MFGTYLLCHSASLSTACFTDPSTECGVGCSTFPMTRGAYMMHRLAHSLWENSRAPWNVRNRSVVDS